MFRSVKACRVYGVLMVLFAFVLVEMWLASEILPVVGVHAQLAVVVVLPVRAPHSLEVKHVEVHINLILLNHLNRELRLVVGKGAVLLILALWSLPRL